MSKNIHEILEEVHDAQSWEEKIKILQENDSQTLRTILYMAFKPNIVFFLDEIPISYNANNCPIGMGETNLHMESRLFHYFLQDCKILYKKKVFMLLGLLEALEEREANVVINMIKKDMDEYGLRVTMVTTAFPNIGL